MQIIIKIMFGVMALIILMALSPTIEDFSLELKESDTFNCKDYTHATDFALSYNSSFDTNSLGCAVSSLITPILILLILMAVVGWIMYGKLEETPSYGMGMSYPTGY